MRRACLFLAAGVYAPQLTSFAVNSDLTTVALVAFFAVLIAGRFREAGFIAAGAACFVFAANDVINSRIPPELVGDSLVAKVRVAGFPKPGMAGVSFMVESGDARLPRRIRVTWHEPPVTIRMGDVWKLELRLRRPRGNSNPGAFDVEAWLLRERIGAVGYVVNGSRNHLLRSRDLDVVAKARQRVVDRVTHLISNRETAAVLAAITVGARHLISAEQWHRYALSGTSHLMAISGLHVGLAAAGGYALLSAVFGLCCRRLNSHVAATIAAVTVALVYATFSGLAVPARRATLMLALAAIVIVARRPLRPVTVVAAACVMVIVSTPLDSMSAGFKLSFAAVLALVWLGQRYHGAISPRRSSRLSATLRQLASVQVMLFMGLLPLTVMLFGRIPVAAPITNLVAVPVFSFVTVPFALLGVLLDGRLQFAGDRALQLAAASLRMLESTIAAAAAVAGADIPAASPVGWAWLLVALPLCWLLLPVGWPGRQAAVVAAAALVLYEPPRPPAGCADIEVLDVGQGLAVVLLTQRHAVVYDTGPAFRGGGSAARSVILPYLRRRGIKHIDKLVVSHGDLDHAGGIAALLSEIEALDILAGERLPAQAAEPRRCVAGFGWAYNDVAFDFVHPPAIADYRGNDASCVLVVSAGSHRVLLTGDIERSVEESLVRRGVLPVVDALVVPHHGSRTSSGLPFIAATRPRLAIVSAGYGNRWGFPKDDVVARWNAAGAGVLVTSTSGAIRIRLCADGGVRGLQQYRFRQRRIWHE